MGLEFSLDSLARLVLVDGYFKGKAVNTVKSRLRIRQNHGDLSLRHSTFLSVWM